MWIAKNAYLSYSEMQENVAEIWAYMGAKGCTKNGVSALCANMQDESTINPGIWESLTPSYTPGQQVGYGLVQWTPWNKYADWAGSGWENNGPKQCERIIYESKTGIQWFENYAAPNIDLPVYPEFSLWDLLTSDGDPRDLASAFMAYYEHPREDLLVTTNPSRRSHAVDWWDFLSGEPLPTPGPPSSDTTPIEKIPVWMMLKPYYKRF